MNDAWYYRSGGQEMGPVSRAELAYLRRAGRLDPRSEVRRGPRGDWQPLTCAVGPCDEPLPNAARPALAADAGGDRADGRAAPAALPTSAPPCVPPPLPRWADDRQQLGIVVASVAAGVLALLLLLAAWFLWPQPANLAAAGGPSAEPAGGHTDRGAAPGPEAATQGDAPGEASGASGELQQPPGGAKAAARETSEAPPSKPAPKPPQDSLGETPHAPPSEAPRDKPAPPTPEQVEEATFTVVDASQASAPPPNSPAEPDPRGAGEGKKSGAGDEEGGQAEFFGLKAKGKKVAYVVDCSGSMQGMPFDRTCHELLRSIGDLKGDQQFFVVFFSSAAYVQFYPRPLVKWLAATKANKQMITEWVSGASAGGGTDPSDALEGTLRLRPDVIFLLTDGQFAPAVRDMLKIANRRPVPIHTVAFINRSGESLLQQISADSGGKYTFVP